MNRAPTFPPSLLCIAALLVTFQASAATLTGKVVKVTDGDTITILVGKEQHRIRLQGIDAPERKQPYGKASGRSLSALVAGKQVRVEYDKRDRYGRILGVNGRELTSIQVASTRAFNSLEIPRIARDYGII